MADRFSWKPALLAREDTLIVDGSRVTLDSEWQIDLAAVEDVALYNQVIKGNRFVRLDLYTADGRNSIGYNGARAGYAADPDARAHLAACSATLRAFATAQPGATVTLGVIRGGRWGMFLVGLGALAGATVLSTAALVSGISSDRLLAAAVPTVVMFAMGAILVYGNWPWRKRPRVNPSALADTLDGMLANPATNA